MGIIKFSTVDEMGNRPNGNGQIVDEMGIDQVGSYPFNAQWVVGMIWQKTANNPNHSIIMLSISWER